MTIDTLIAELRAGLEGTTPGTWGRNDTDDYAEIIAHDLTRPVALVGRADDADHVCRCSPDNVRALLDHIERLTDPRQIVGGGYVQLSDYDAMQARAEAAEAELARLRAPVTDGEVVDCLAKLNNRKVNEPDFGMRLRHETADLLTRLAKERDECLFRSTLPHGERRATSSA